MRVAALLARARSAGLVVGLDDGRLAVSGKSNPPLDLMAQLRTHKAALVEHLQAEWMPAGAGVCPVCNEVRWLRAGPPITPCDACAALLADEAEVTLRGELP